MQEYIYIVLSLFKVIVQCRRQTLTRASPRESYSVPRARKDGTEHYEGLAEARSLRKASLGKALFGLKSQLSGQKGRQGEGKARQVGTGIS